MRIFTPDIKTVRELTRYISPKEIEQARFKKYNEPIINDGNLACDEFFRTEELFNRKTDYVDPSYRSYSTNDLPAIDRTSINACDERRLFGSNSGYIESDLPYYVDIIGTRKRIYLEEFGTKNPKYPHEEMAGDNYPNLTVDEVVNIKYHANDLYPENITAYTKPAFKLLQTGYPLEGVINLMKSSAIKSSNGEITSAEPILFKFLIQHPTLRNYVVNRSPKGNEYFDTHAAIMFNEVLEACNGEPKDAYKIICDCKVDCFEDVFFSDKRVITTAINLLKTDGVWSEDKIQVINLIKRHYGLAIGNYTGRVNNMIKNDKSIKEIIEYLTPKEQV